MFTQKAIAVSTLVVMLGTVANGQALQNAKPPANIPPASFDGLQFVDNKGCVFVRSGYGGRVTWVPRVDRKRRQLCDKSFEPTFAAVRAVPAADPKETDVAAVRKPAKTGGFLADLKKSLTQTPKPKVVASVEPVAEPVIEPVVAPVVKAPQKVAAVVTPDVAAKPKLTLKDIFGTRSPKKVDPVLAGPSAVDLPSVDSDEPIDLVPAAPKPVVKPTPKPEPKPTPKPEPKPVVAPVVKPVAVVAPKPAPAPKPKPKASTPSLPSGVYVNVATFTDLDEAATVVSWFKKTGHKAQMDGNMLKVGPFRSESVAKAALYQATGAGYKKARIVTR